MSRRRQFLIIFVVVLALTSALCHLIAWKFKILTHAGENLHFGTNHTGKVAFAAGSSLAFYGIAWSDVAATYQAEVVGHAVPGASVREMEVFYRRHPEATLTFIGISAYDINEHHMSNYRAQVVPFREEVARLWEARASWSQAKKVLSQYPMEGIRAVFPTAGAYGAVMVKTREILRSLVRRPAAAAAPPKPEGAVITDKGNPETSTIRDWDDAHLQRSISDIRSHGGGEFEFQSTKRKALIRFIRQAAHQGKVAVIVIPESPVYQREFLTPDASRRFEELVAAARREVPEAAWIRLDQVPELASNNLYWDLIHMNAQGQAIATAALLGQLRQAGLTP
ncbi:MAG: SGNH/GDSL hydrolase family protein [Verrucomicrobiota bacterium]